MPLLTLDPTKGILVDYGTGTVSDNGATIIPDFDPATPGRRYGLVHFDWHAPRPPPPPEVNPPLQSTPYKGEPVFSSFNTLGSCPRCGDPIDLATGLVIIVNTDLQISGPRGTIAVERIYRSLSEELGPFGIGSSDRYGYQLDTRVPESTNLINLIMPDGNRIRLSKDDNGIFGSLLPSMRGVTLTVPSKGKADLRWRDGTIYHFVAVEVSVASLGSVLDSIEYTDGNRIQLLRNPENPIQITKIIDPVGRQIALDYDSSNRITKATDPIGRVVTYSYDDSGHLATITDPEGGVTRYTYTPNSPTVGGLETVTDARDIIVAQNEYYGDENISAGVSKQIQADGSFLSFSYNVVVSSGPFPRDEDREVGRLPLNSPLYASGGPFSSKSAFPTSTYTDAMGNKTRFARKRFNNNAIRSVSDALGQGRGIGYYENFEGFSSQTLNGPVSRLTGPGTCMICGNTTAGNLNLSYDDLGNVLILNSGFGQEITDFSGQTTGLGQTTRFTYDKAFNKVTSITDPLGDISRFTYDGQGNLTSATDPNDITVTYSYDAFGLLTGATDALLNETVMEYDTWGNLIKITDPLGNSTSFVYDAISRLIETTDSLGRTSKTEYDKLDRIVATTDPLGNITRFTYDAVGNLLTVTDAKNQTTRFVYDVMNRLVSRTDPLENVELFDYDRNGNLIEYTDRRGQISSFEYDALNRLIKSTYQDGSTVARRYDAYGRLVEVDDSISGLTIMAYDAVGRLLRMSNSLGTIDYARDFAGQVRSSQIQGQSAVDYAYDPNGNLLSTITPQASVDFTYDIANRLASLSRGNGVETAYDYDPLDRLTSMTHRQGATLFDSQTYAYDKVGNRSSHHTDLGASYQTQASNRVYGPGNRLLQIDGVTYTYDKNGNRLTETGPAGMTTYTWDARNRLTQITAPDGEITSFLYDALGNLMRREVTGPGGNFDREFFVDELSNVVQMSDSTGRLASVLTGRSIDSHLAIFDDNGQTDYLLGNGINSTVATTDENGVIGNQYAYEPFGETTTEGSRDNIFQYTGRVPVAENLYYYRARFYDPKAGRFISEDPIGFGGGDVNLYRYVGNSPSNYVDPLGFLKFKFVEAQDGVLIESDENNFFLRITNLKTRISSTTTIERFNKEVDKRILESRTPEFIEGVVNPGSSRDTVIKELILEITSKDKDKPESVS